MSLPGKVFHRCSLLEAAVVLATVFVCGAVSSPTQIPNLLQVDEGWSAPEVQDELMSKHVTSPSIEARKYM